VVKAAESEIVTRKAGKRRNIRFGLFNLRFEKERQRIIMFYSKGGVL
jgi:hypothetical protein